MKRFPKKRIIITGAGSGLGRAISLEFAQMAWKIIVADVNMERAEETVTLINSAGGEGIAINCDVSRPEDLENAAELLEKEWGGVDIVVNNAGIAAGGYMEKIPLEEWDRIIGINFKGIIHGCRTFIPVLEKQGGGYIVNVASNAGIASLPEMSSYNATKAAAISLSETLKIELVKKNIGVTVVAPTFFKTNLMDSFTSPDERQRIMANAFFDKSTCSAEDVARLTVKAITRNKTYVVTPLDGNLTWYFKRLFPELYFKLFRFGYKSGWGEKSLGG